jgi:hypothetical protein
MATLTVEAPLAPVKKGTRGQIIVSTNIVNIWASMNGLNVDIESLGTRTATPALVWRGSTAFKNGSAVLDLTWPDTPGQYQILAKSVNMVGKELDFVVKLFEVID